MDAKRRAEDRETPERAVTDQGRSRTTRRSGRPPGRPKRPSGRREAKRREPTESLRATRGRQERRADSPCGMPTGPPDQTRHRGAARGTAGTTLGSIRRTASKSGGWQRCRSPFLCSRPSGTWPRVGRVATGRGISFNSVPSLRSLARVALSPEGREDAPLITATHGKKGRGHSAASITRTGPVLLIACTPLF